MKNKLLTITALLLLVISSNLIVSAESLPIHFQNTEWEFAHGSDFATECTLSYINTPRGSVLIDETVYRDNGVFLHTISGEHYSSVGEYCHVITCTDGVNERTADQCVLVTDNKPSNFIYLIFYGLILFMIIISFFVEYGDTLTLIASGLLFMAGLLLLLYDFGITNKGMIWGLVISHWGFALLMSFKNIAKWLEGIE